MSQKAAMLLFSVLAAGNWVFWNSGYALSRVIAEFSCAGFPSPAQKSGSLNASIATIGVFVYPGLLLMYSWVALIVRTHCSSL